MSRTIFFAFAACLLAAPSHAQAADAAMEADARSIVATMNFGEQIDAMMEGIMPMLAQSVIADIQKSSAPLLARYVEKPGGIEGLTQILTEEFRRSFQSRHAQFNAIFQDHLLANFSREELRQAAEFARTPAGAKLLAMDRDMKGVIEERAGMIGMEAGIEALPRALARGSTEILE